MTDPIPILLIPGLLGSPRLYAEQVPHLWRLGPVTIADHTRDDDMAAIARRILASAPPRFALIGISMVLMVFLGGLGTLSGPVVGALLLEPAQLQFAYRFGASKLYLVLYSAVFLVVILLMPRGIVPSARDLIARRRRPRAAGPTGTVTDARAASITRPLASP